MPSVKVRVGEPVDRALRILKKENRQRGDFKSRKIPSFL